MHRRINVEMCLMNVAAVLRLKGSFRHNALCNVDVSISLKFSKKKDKK